MLNTSEDILVLVDEAHRTQAGDLHANMMRALPNAARIGFTGTPIIMGEKKRTHDIFGDYIDRYTIKEAEQDGATVPILYEGRTVKGAIKDGASLDGLFEDLFRSYSDAHARRLGLTPAGIKVQDLGFRRGSCGRGDWLYFHWKTILLPRNIAEYVAVHELIHLHEPHHTPEFWRRLERAMPDYDQRKRWLAEHGIEVVGV